MSEHLTLINHFSRIFLPALKQLDIQSYICNFSLCAQGCPSWKWFYPYHYAPFVSDFKNITRVRNDFDRGTTPFAPLEQLMGVFPASSGKFLPLSWRELMMRDVGCVSLFLFPSLPPLSLPSFPYIDTLLPLTLYNIIICLSYLSLFPPPLPSSISLIPCPPPPSSVGLSYH